MILLLILASGFIAGPAVAAEPNLGLNIRVAMKEEWAKLVPKRGMFSPAYTQFFRASWPYDGKRVNTYFYANGYDPKRGISDGQIRGTVWAVAHLDLPTGQVVKVVRLADKIKELGIQGVRPLKREEIEINNEGGISSRTAPIETDAEIKKVRDYYCQWRTVDGVIAREIESREKAFFKWLDCAAWKGPSSP